MSLDNILSNGMDSPMGSSSSLESTTLNIPRTKLERKKRGRMYLCSIEGCLKCAHRGGLCVKHGGGLRCRIPGCTKSAQSKHLCYFHGGGRRCHVKGCHRAIRKDHCCRIHFEEKQLKITSSSTSTINNQDAEYTLPTDYLKLASILN